MAASPHFTQICIIATTAAAVDTAAGLVAFLRGRGHHPLCPADAPLDGARAVPRAELEGACDILLVVGGDGSMLHAARDFAGADIPLLGVHCGRLGFLTEVNPKHLERELGAVLDGRYGTSQRFLLRAELRRGRDNTGDALAFNDIVLHAEGGARMIEFELLVDGQFLCRQRSDGVIIATPTGSTAYALSGGGPIIHPALDCICIVPINPHTLSNRPIVVSAASNIEVRLLHRHKFTVIADGQQQLAARGGDHLQIRNSGHSVRLLHTKGSDFYARCRDKLGWARSH